MCLIVFSYKNTPHHKLILAANRDEFLERPTVPLNYFDTEQTILAGKDLRGGGTWLGVNMAGKVAAITNYRHPDYFGSGKKSRGLILTDYLKYSQNPEAFLEKLYFKRSDYNGFNLLLGDEDDMFYFSSVTGEIELLSPGMYGLSNHLLDSPWPKLEKAKNGLQKIVEEPGEISKEAIFHLLKDRERPPDSALPDTGVGKEWERLLSSIFISSPTYGTRSSAILTLSSNNSVSFIERTFKHSSTAVLEQRCDEYFFSKDKTT